VTLCSLVHRNQEIRAKYYFRYRGRRMYSGMWHRVSVHVNGYQNFEETYNLSFFGVPFCQSTRFQSRKKVVFVVIAVRTSNHTILCLPSSSSSSSCASFSSCATVPSGPQFPIKSSPLPMISNHRLLFLIHLYLNPLKPRFFIFGISLFLFLSF
jgi:hypothetical protein